MISGIYRIINLVTGKSYIGSSAHVVKRWKDHKRFLKSAYHPNPKLQSSFDKHGESAFVAIIIEAVPEDRLIEREQHYLDSLEAVKKGYNLADQAGSPMRGRKHSEETKARVSQALKGRTLSEEHKANLSRSGMGHAVSDEARSKMSASRMGYKNHLGCKHTEETRAKIREAVKGKRNGYKHSEETKAKISATKRARREEQALTTGNEKAIRQD